MSAKFEVIDAEREIDQQLRLLHIQRLKSVDLDGVLTRTCMGSFVFSCSFHLCPLIIKGDKKIMFFMFLWWLIEFLSEMKESTHQSSIVYY